MKQREEKRVTFIYKFSGTAVLLLVTKFKKKKKKVLSFLGMVLSKSNTTQTDSFLRSPDGATLFARREILFFFLIT